MLVVKEKTDDENFLCIGREKFFLLLLKLIFHCTRKSEIFGIPKISKKFFRTRKTDNVN